MTDKGDQEMKKRTYYEAHRDERKAYGKIYYEAHKDKRKDQNKIYYEAHKDEQKAYREAHKDERKTYGKIYNDAHKEEKKAYHKAYREAHKEEQKAYNEAHKDERKTYYEVHRDERKANKKIYDEAHKERRSVAAHHYLIFKSLNPNHKNYKGMPFYASWNPHEGGSFDAAEKWLIENLGKRPERCSLHVINHSLGFVPGNLEWAYPTKQSNQRMFVIIAQKENLIKRLKEQIKNLGGVPDEF